MTNTRSAPGQARDRRRGQGRRISETPETLSVQLDRWLKSEGDKTLGSLIELFEEKSFAILFVLLASVPALPLPTGGATHVFEAIAMLLSLQLIAGREEIWLPRRWRERMLIGKRGERGVQALLRLIRRLERFSHPRGTWLFGHRPGNIVFGVLVFALNLAAFVAPPFSGLDTLPALGVLVLSVGVLLEDVVIAVVGMIVGAAGVLIEFLLGRAAIDAISGLF